MCRVDTTSRPATLHILDGKRTPVGCVKQIKPETSVSTVGHTLAALALKQFVVIV